MPDLIFAIFGIVAILFGLGCVYFGFYMRYMSTQAQYWPSVPGVVVESELYHHSHSDKPDTTSYSIAYDYVVRGRRYRSRVLTYAGVDKSQYSDADLVALFYVGRHVKVYYDPKAPGTATIDNQPSRIWLSAIGMGVVVAIIGIALFLNRGVF